MTKLTDLPNELLSLITEKVSIKDHIQELLKGRDTKEVIDIITGLISDFEIESYNEKNDFLNGVKWCAVWKLYEVDMKFKHTFLNSVKTTMKEAKKSGRSVYLKGTDWFTNPKVLRVNKSSLSVMVIGYRGNTYNSKVCEDDYRYITEIYMK